MAIQLFTPTFDVEGCLEEIRDCLEKGWTGLGYKTVEFEKAWREYTKLPHCAHYVNSATAGLNLVFDCMKEYYGWDDDSEIITTPLTFISTNHAILLADLKAVFADVNDTACLDPKSVEEHITDKTKAVLYVGIGGNAGDYEEIVEICKKHNIKLILDAAHMAGTRLNGKMIGEEADAIVYSFQAVKNLPTADSGMLCFKEATLDEMARKKTWLGINKDTYTRTNMTGGSYKWKYDVEYVGNKYHGNSIMAAIGLTQLKRLEQDNAYRKQIASWYRKGFAGYEDKIKLIRIPESCDSSCHLFQILVDRRDECMLALNQQEIYPGVHYVDNTMYRMYSYADGSCPNARYMSEHIISLPIHLRLTYDDVQTVIKAVIDFVENTAK